MDTSISRLSIRRRIAWEKNKNKTSSRQRERNCLGSNPPVALLPSRAGMEARGWTQPVALYLMSATLYSRGVMPYAWWAAHNCAYPTQYTNTPCENIGVQFWPRNFGLLSRYKLLAEGGIRLRATVTRYQSYCRFQQKLPRNRAKLISSRKSQLGKKEHAKNTPRSSSATAPLRPPHIIRKQGVLLPLFLSFRHGDSKCDWITMTFQMYSRSPSLFIVPSIDYVSTNHPLDLKSEKIKINGYLINLRSPAAFSLMYSFI